MGLGMLRLQASRIAVAVNPVGSTYSHLAEKAEPFLGQATRQLSQVIARQPAMKVRVN